MKRRSFLYSLIAAALAPLAVALGAPGRPEVVKLDVVYFRFEFEGLGWRYDELTHTKEK